MLNRTEFIFFLNQFSKSLIRVIKKIETNKIELTEEDREIIKVLLEAFINREKK